MRELNAAGIALIKSSEGLRLEAYRDQHGIPTIGWGHTLGVHMGQEITEAEADRFLIDDVANAVAIVERRVTVELNDNQFAALVSLAFNCPAAFGPTSTLLKRLNRGDYASVPDQIVRWDKVTIPHTGEKIPSAGLLVRRRAEATLWEAACAASASSST